MSVINDAKQKIYDKLSVLLAWPITTKTQLGTIEIADIRRDPLDMEIQRYPAAFIRPPAIQTVAWEDNRSVVRELTFTVTVIQKMDNLTTTSEIEDLMEAMMNLIDNSITFDNVARAGVFPTASFPEAYTHGSHNLIVFDIIIKAHVLQELTYT